MCTTLSRTALSTEHEPGADPIETVGKDSELVRGKGLPYASSDVRWIPDPRIRSCKDSFQNVAYVCSAFGLSMTTGNR